MRWTRRWSVMRPWMVLMVLLWGLVCPSAIASIHHYPEGEGREMVRSLQTLRESPNAKLGPLTERAWQVVLYKRLNQGQVTEVHLRLVGFPGVEVNHQGALVITPSTGQTATAPDVTLAGPALTPNAAEYDLRDFLATLDADIPLTLVVPLRSRNAQLVVPPFAVQEWRRLKDTA